MLCIICFPVPSQLVCVNLRLLYAVTLMLFVVLCIVNLTQIIIIVVVVAALLLIIVVVVCNFSRIKKHFSR